MKKLLFLFLVSISLENFSQEDEGVTYAKYSGWSMEAFITGQFSEQPGSDMILPFYGIGLYPRYNRSLVNYFSVAIGTPINGGFEAQGSSTGSYFQFFADVPIELSLNLGSQATKDADYFFGAYIGGGLDYNYSVFSNSLGYRVNSHSFGPMISAGIRYMFRGRPIGIRLSYMLGMVNNFKEDPYIIYNKSTNPKILTLSLTSSVR